MTAGRRDWFEGSFKGTFTKASCGWSDTWGDISLLLSNPLSLSPKGQTTFGTLLEANFRGGILLREEVAGDFS